MPDANMRRVGLKLVFAVALTVLLVSSVHQQWNSAKEKLTRGTSSDLTDSNADEGVDDIGSHNRKGYIANSSIDSQVNELVDLIASDDDDKVTEAETGQTKDTELEGDDAEDEKENDAGFADEFHGDGEVDITDDETEYEIAKEGSDNDTLLRTVDSTPGAHEKEGNLPEYEDDNDPNWRDSKYTNVLFDDKEGNDNEDNDLENVLELNGTIVNGNGNIGENSQQLSDQGPVDNTSKKESSMFQWFSLGQYLPFVGNSQQEQTKDANEDYNGINNVYDDSPVYGENGDLENTKANSSYVTENDDNVDSELEYKDVGKNEKGNEMSFQGAIQNNGNLDEVAHKKDVSESFNNLGTEDNNLPFNINGLDNQIYDDSDGVAEKNYQSTKKADTSLEFKEESSLTGPARETPGQDVGRPTWRNTAGESRSIGLRLLNQGSQAVQMGAAQTNKPYGSYFLQGTQHYEKQIQPTLYQKQTYQQLPQLPEQHQQILKSFFPPRIVDLLLSGNFESSNLKQYPSKLQYFMHQNIHRIDQDFDPLANNSKSTTGDLQLQLPVPLPIEGEPQRPMIQGTENTQYEGYDNNINYEDVDNYNTDNDFVEQDNFGNNNENIENLNDLRIKYTPAPDKDTYDNPRPLSESEFALFRTKAYNANNAPSDGALQSPVDNNYVFSDDEESESVQSQLQQIDSNAELEDETLKCPREVTLAKKSYPVTALVAFPDASTAWFRTMLEQLTGMETDSIYNIRAQLKAGNADGVYQMGMKSAIETHMATDKNFDRAILVIRNPFSVDQEHKTFRPLSVEWQKSVLWNQTFSVWLSSSLPLLVLTYEDLVERPLTEMMKVTKFLSNPEAKVSYRCAMDVALKPPAVIDDISQITGIYQEDRKRINQNIDYLIKVATNSHPEISRRLNSYKVYST